MDKSKFYARAKEVFTLHKTDKVFFTSDGQAFLQRHFADAHGQTLADKEVTEVTEAEIERAGLKTEDKKAEINKADELTAEEKAAAAAEKAATALADALAIPEGERSPYQKGLITKAAKAADQEAK